MSSDTTPKYRLVYNKVAKTYHIQKKRLFLPGYKMLDHIVGKHYDRGKAAAKLHALRETNKKRKTFFNITCSKLKLEIYKIMIICK